MLNIMQKRLMIQKILTLSAFNIIIKSTMQSILRTYQSCYVGNTSYTAPGIELRMEAYKTIDYTYVLSVNNIDTIRRQVKDIHDTGQVTNAGMRQGDKVGLDAWARADKIWTQL